MRVKTGITVAPRPKNYLNKTIESVPVSLGDLMYFAEPGTDIKPSEEVVIHKDKLGCLGNWDFAARYLLNMHSDFVCILQDDVEFLTCSIINKLQPSENAGFYSFYTPKFYKKKVTRPGWNAFNNGWNSVGACALLFPKRSLFLLLNDVQYQNHLMNYQKNEQVDAIVCSVFERLGLPTYYHNPSLCNHIGEISTLNHKNPKNITDAL